MALGIELLPGNIVRAEDVRRAVSGCDAVYHMAALHRETRDADGTYRGVNVEGTENVLRACRSEGIRRLVHCSTVGVHGSVDVPADENAPFGPRDVHERSKLDGELLARDYIDAGLPGTICRPAGIHGPGDLRFVRLFRAIRQGSFRMIGDGRVLCHMTYIDDLIQGIVLCGEHPAALGQTYILCGPRYTTLSELAKAVAAAVGSKPPRRRVPLWPVRLAAHACEAVCRPLGLDPPSPMRRPDFAVDDRGFTAAKAARELGYAPRVSLEEGMGRTAAWYRQERLI